MSAAVMKLLKRLVILAILGAVVYKVVESKSGSNSSASGSWPPIKSPGSGNA